MAVNLSALRTGRTLLLRDNFYAPVHISVRGCINLRAYCTWKYYVPSCSIVPQPTMLPREQLWNFYFAFLPVCSPTLIFDISDSCHITLGSSTVSSITCKWRFSLTHEDVINIIIRRSISFINVAMLNVMLLIIRSFNKATWLEH
jgi:hypothetical protein